MPHLSTSLAGSRTGLEHNPISSSRRDLPSTVRKPKAPTRRKRASSRRYLSDDYDYNEDDGSKAQSASARIKPAQAALQTQKMLEESGSGKYWGTVYSLNGERIGMSFVGNNLQNVTVKAVGSSSASTRDHSPFQRRRVYVGRWQDAWGLCLETSDDSHSEGEMRANKRSRSRKVLGRARSYYVGNQNVIKAWRRTQSKTLQSPPVVPPLLSDGVDVHVPSFDPLPFGKACDHPETTYASPTAGALIDEEDQDDIRRYWAMEDGLFPKERNPFLASTIIPGPGLGNIDDVLDVCSTFESCEQLVPQQALAEVVASSLEAVGTTVLIPQPPLSLSTFSY